MQRAPIGKAIVNNTSINEYFRNRPVGQHFQLQAANRPQNHFSNFSLPSNTSELSPVQDLQ